MGPARVGALFQRDFMIGAFWMPLFIGSGLIWIIPQANEVRGRRLPCAVNNQVGPLRTSQ